MQILIRRAGRVAWSAPSTTAYTDELALERLIEQSPTLLPGSVDSQPVVVLRQVHVSTGVIDLLGVSRKGDITIIECKLAANPEIRRSIVGQVFAYAAALWGMDYDSFDGLFAAKRGRRLLDELQDGDDSDATAVRDAISHNLATGRFRLIIAVDSITPELRRIVEYLNEHTRSDVQFVALELRYLADKDVELLVPNVYGVEAAEKKAQSSQPTTTEGGLFEWLDVNTPEQTVAAVRRIYDWAMSRWPLPQGPGWGKGASPSLSGWHPIDGHWVSTWAIYTGNNPSFSLNLKTLSKKVHRQRLLELLTELRQVPDLAPRLSRTDDELLNSYPSFPLTEVIDRPGVSEALVRALDRLIGPTGEA